MDWKTLVREARLSLDLTQEQMAAKLGVSQTTVSQIERGLNSRNEPGEWFPSWALGERIKAASREAKRKARKPQPTQQDA